MPQIVEPDAAQAGAIAKFFELAVQGPLLEQSADRRNFEGRPLTSAEQQELEYRGWLYFPSQLAQVLDKSHVFQRLAV